MWIDNFVTTKSLKNQFIESQPFRSAFVSITEADK